MRFKLIIDEKLNDEIIVYSNSKNEITNEIENLVLNYNGTNKISILAAMISLVKQGKTMTYNNQRSIQVYLPGYDMKTLNNDL